MRSLERNKQVVWYALYSGMAPVLDEWGNDTGQVAPSYSNPVKFKARVSPNKGSSSEEAFGIMTDYDRAIVTTDNLPITETSILWIGIMPIIETDGSTLTAHDYKVVKVAPDLNVKQYAVKKVVT